MKFMSGKLKSATSYFVNVLTVSLIAFMMMNPIGGTLRYFITFGSRHDWGEFYISGIRYLVKLSAVSLLVQFFIVLIATILAKKIIRNIRWYVMLAAFAFALLCVNIPQSGMYGLDIYFTNEFWSNYTIATAPLLLFALFCALPLRSAFVPIPEGNNAAMSLIVTGIVIYIGVMFFIFGLIVLQPDWSQWFQFYSEFDNQGRGG